jgi:hypothetical protein
VTRTVIDEHVQSLAQPALAVGDRFHARDAQALAVMPVLPHERGS